MGTNQLMSIGVGLFQNRTIDDEHREVLGRPPGFGLANQRGLPPDGDQVPRGAAQPACDVVVAQGPI